VQRSRAGGLLLCSCLGFLGCGGDPNAPNAGCDDQVSLQVSAGLTPTFRWSPNCAVYNLVVLAGEGPPSFEQVSAMWAVEAPPDRYGLPNNRLHSGIVYGEPPPEARQSGALVPLIAGRPYFVYLNVYTLNQRIAVVGWRNFTP
jgi:hypothetical protein